MQRGGLARLACWLLSCAVVPALAQTPPAGGPPAAEATLEQDRLPTAGEHATLLRVAQPGRFAIKAESATGTALQLVDMQTGPSDLAGEAGTGDGRIDQLLDVGTYKVRLFGAAGAQGETHLSVIPFRDRAPPAMAPPATAEEVTSDLADLQQRSFRIAVSPSGSAPSRVRIEAAGRSLRDLRLWRDGTDLVPIEAASRTIEPTSGHPLTDLLLDGAVEPGSYVITAYGGAALTWADGGAAQPFYLRIGTAPSLADGWVRDRIGPFGNQIYEVGTHETSFRLDLADPAPVQLSVHRDSAVLGQASIAKNSREPNATVAVAGGDDGKRLVQVTGSQGQEFALRSFHLSGTRSLAKQGTWWLAAETVGVGGDELPATALLLRQDPVQGVSPLAGSGPRIGRGQAWRWRFNLRGASSLLLEVIDAGPLAVRADGPAVEATIDTLGGERFARRSDGATPSVWDLAAGWYVLRLKPIDGASGPLDLTIGPPGLIPDRPTAPQPPAPVIAFGQQTVQAGQRLNLVSGEGPGVAVALSAREVPVDLSAAPLVVTAAAQQAVELPVRLPPTGRLAAIVIGEGPAAVELRAPHEVAGKQVGTAWVAAAGHARTVILAWHPPAAAASAPPPAAAAPAPPPALEAGRPHFFDLAKDQQRSFAFAIPQGGLYRVETLGRLKTEGWIGNSFISEIDHETANGHGQNVLLQDYLRAGRYRVTVAARESAGRAGILASPAPQLAGATLVPGGSVRAAMPAGSGVAFPIEIAAAGTYHLDLLGLGRSFDARLEDDEGWPILAAGDLSSLDRTLAPGRYRVLVLPIAVDARVIARLARVEPEVALQGHGPHPLLFDADQHFQWREPPGRDDPRPPDRWDFALEGPAHVTLAISDGMVAELLHDDASSNGTTVARLVYKSDFAGELPAGRYHVAATSLGRNDRLDYKISLHSEELQPGRPRPITLPATVPFAIDRARVVSLTSFGNVDVKAVLRDGEGHVIGRFDDRSDDWNIAVSRNLPAGHYVVELSKVAPPAAERAGSAEGDSDDRDDPDTNQAAAASSDQPQEGEAAPAAAETADEHVELRLMLPAEATTVEAPSAGAVTLRGAEIHRLAMPPATAGELIVAAATATAELALEVERRNPDGSWHSVGLDQGLAPVVAIPSDDDTTRPWRVSVWTVDGGAEPATFAFRSVPAAAQPVGAVDLAPLALDGNTRPLRTALVAAPAAGLLRLGDATTGLLAGSVAGEALRPIEGGVVVPQSDRVWLLTRDGATAKLDLAALVPAAGQPIALSLPAGGVATLPVIPAAADRLRFWLAQSGFGQPAVAAGRGMGVAPGSAFALAGPTAVRAWNAGGGDGLRLRLATGEMRLLPERQTDTSFSGTVPAHSALPLRLPAGGKRLRLDLPAGAAAIAGWRDAAAATAWTGERPASWTLDGDWVEVLLANSGANPLAMALSLAPLTGAPSMLRSGAAEKRFFGAAGTLSLPLEASPGQRLVVAGAAATVIGADGQVRRGAVIPLSGPGRIMLEHPPGLVAAWIEGEGVSPWPPSPPQKVPLPAQLTLAGDTMTLSLSPPTAALLHARTTAPVIVILRRDNAEEAPLLFPAGAEFHRYIAPGPVELRLISPHDGPLAGSLELDTTPVTPAGEGVGEAVAVAPGGTALFAFDVVKDGAVGVGIRADPDRATVRLLDQNGTVLGTGVAMLRRLHPGHYLIEAGLPADAATAMVQPAVVGITPRPSGPPADVMRKYLELVGMVPATVR
jgi:hypothetical protein